MARFYGTLVGNSDTVVTRTGTSKSGVRATAAGWNLGATAWASSCWDADGDEDVVGLYIDGGSNGTNERLLDFGIWGLLDGRPNPIDNRAKLLWDILKDKGVI